MAQCQSRDVDGYPIPHGPLTRPRATLTTGAGAQYGNQVDASVGKKINEPLPWVALACLIAGLSLGVSLMQGPISDAKLDKSKAELRAEFAQQIADARSEAKAAGTDAAIWK